VRFWVALILVAAGAAALLVLYDRGRRPVRGASPLLTPGALNRDVTQATIHTTICVQGWTQTVRPPWSYTHALEVRQLREYGRSGSTRDYQEDHFISLELGGAPRDPRNLWPEPLPRAHAVDRIENQLREQVCSGRLPLAEAQRREAELKYRDG